MCVILTHIVFLERDFVMKKTALITGASRGIGKAIAEAFAKKGYDLILTCVSSISTLEEYALYLENTYNICCQTLKSDAGDYAQVQALFAQIKHLDILVNNAGIAHIGLLSDMSPEEWHHIMHTNLDACFYTCKHAIPLMLKKHSGRIINITSVWGNVGSSMEVAYSASKGGVNTFTKALAKELAPSNIQVNAIACGAIDTDMNKCFSEEDLELLAAEIPADRLGRTEEVASLACYLAEAPEYLTGQIITIDGGWC